MEVAGQRIPSGLQTPAGKCSIQEGIDTFKAGLNADNTLKSVERIALGNGFDSFIMFNVYAQRATSPDDMEKVCNPQLHQENLKAFRYVLSISEKPAVWAAWGAIIEKRKYLPDCVRDMLMAGEAFGAQWYCAGAITKKGHPHHPLYLRKDEKIKPFDVKSYLDKL